MKTLLITLLCAGSLYAQENQMKTVDYVDIERFMGKWFVTAIVPNMIENGAANASDIYELNSDGTIAITYDAIKDGKKKQIQQKGTIVNKESNAEWSIQMKKPYIPFLKFPFKIILIDNDYNYMAVGYPDNKMGWIMCREAEMDEVLYKNILTELTSFGYTKEQFVRILHN
jgi:apolipoprotein D and lipocalin family protein|tara:strand:- start:174 stop:686 length:513 start_codon:yes stop_codon:yes gene_type:complete